MNQMKSTPVLLVRAMILLLMVSFMGLFANASNKSAKQYIITELGAVGDGITVNTVVIQVAINKCSADEGGVIVVPNGMFLTGAIFLKQGVDLNIEKGGILKGSVNQSDYPQINTRWVGEERIWTSALINIIDVQNVNIYGEGTIDGSGTEWPGFGSNSRQQRQPLSQAAKDSIRKMPRLGRPRLICFQNCSKVRISDLNLRDQSVWCLHILYCTDVLVKNHSIRAAHNIPSSEGIDVDSSNRVAITGCFIDVNSLC